MSSDAALGTVVVVVVVVVVVCTVFGSSERPKEDIAEQRTRWALKVLLLIDCFDL